MAASVITVDYNEMVVPQGPFGGSSGPDDFYDGVGDVVKITVTYSIHAVYSMQTTYQQGGTIFTTSRNGSEGPSTFTITLDFPVEHLVQVQGTTGNAEGYDVVTSLTFITNKTTYGPFGAESDCKFQSLPQGRVMGFFSKTGALLDRIGILTKFAYDPVSPEGPWGGDRGIPFYDGAADKIVKISVEYNDHIVSLMVKYAQGNQHYPSAKHGGNGSDRGSVEKIVFKSDEYLTQVMGTLDDNGKSVVSLTLISNKTSYGPFGNEHKPNSFQTTPNAHVLGFFGRCGSKLDQLGAFVRVPSLPVFARESWGGDGGDAFYEGRGKIDRITLVHTSNHICRLQVTYLQGGTPFDAHTHGTEKGHTNVIKLSPNEHVVQVRGTHGRGADVLDLIRSLEFITNKGIYGSCGNTEGTSFASKLGTIVGFFGRSGNLLDKLGVIVFDPIDRLPT